MGCIGRKKEQRNIVRETVLVDVIVVGGAVVVVRVVVREGVLFSLVSRGSQIC